MNKTKLGILSAFAFLATMLMSVGTAGAAIPSACTYVNVTGGYIPISCTGFYQSVATGVQINTVATVGAVSNATTLLGGPVLDIILALFVIFAFVYVIAYAYNKFFK